MLDVAGLGACLSEARHDLLRVEALDEYDVASDGGDFMRYVHGEPEPELARKAAWHERLRAERARGLRRRQVHILCSPIGAYLRYECEWGYARNGGLQEIRILDLAETPCPDGLLVADFWVKDGQDVVLMDYTPEGAFTGAQVLEPDVCGHYRAAAVAAWEAGQDFGTWWQAHPQYHRSARTAA